VQLEAAIAVDTFTASSGSAAGRLSREAGVEPVAEGYSKAGSAAGKENAIASRHDVR
jgi:hypothetical protein